ncbi:MAG: class I SAM-dependent methyltransferase [Novosphingobium sp.]|jgi:ubiquinone/menaquinone biosynthesis C-methylase UbiE|nr:class I SAM-dependent methyltransferase [Novosphingobium sp.]
MGLASWYDEHVVPRLIRCACSGPQIMKIRSQVVPQARGAVFELGCGGGINQQFYDPARITSYAGIDPSVKGLEFAREAAAAKGWAHEIKLGCGEDIPFADNSFDSVVCTYTLCSVDDPARTLSELHRVLRPGGVLLFAEHGAAPDPGVALWQRRVEPFWKRIAGGCHLTRPVGSAIQQGGFAVEPIGARFAPKMPRIAGWMEWGLATKVG